MGMPAVVLAAVVFVAVFVVCGFFGMVSFDPFPGRFYVSGFLGAGALFGAVAVFISFGRR